MGSFGWELRLAARGLRRSPGYTAAAVVTLALGIGANAAIFTGVEAALLRPLPYGEPERLVHLWETTPESARRQLSYPDYLDLRDGAAAFSAVAGYGFFGATLESGDGTDLLAGARVSANFFSTLGVEPALGRGFLPEEDAVDRPRDVVVLSDGAWRRRFGGDPDIVGRTLRLTGTAYSVIGVLPRGFHFARLGDPEFFVTLSPNALLAERRYTHWMWGVARLAPGVELAAARAELATLAARRAEEDARWHAESGLDAMALREAFVGDVRPLLVGLLAGVGAVLLIACANVANMTLARAAGRERELGLRVALGAGRARLARQLLAESLLVAAAGGALGVALSLVATRVLVAAVPAERAARLPFLQQLEPNLGVLLFTGALCLGATLAIGLLPAWRAPRAVAAVLRDGAHGSARRRPLRELLLVGEIALALVLLAAAGLTHRSLARLLAVDAGFERERLLTAFVALPRARYDTPEKLDAAFAELERRLAALPGAAGATTTNILPLTGSGNTGAPTVVGRPEARQGSVMAQMRSVGSGYFGVLGVPVVAGRPFAAGDRRDAPDVVAINARLARELFAQASPLGERLSFNFLEGRQFEIVAVVGDENVVDLDAPPEPTLYFPAAQDGASSAYLVVRTSGGPEALARPLVEAVRAFEPAAAISEVAPLESIVRDTPPVFLRRFPLLLLGAFAALALVLSAVGVYGVMACFVGQRTREIGIRMAVGARVADVQALVLRRGAAAAAAGVALGTLGAWGAGRLLSRLLYDTAPFEPGVLAGAAAVLIAVALAACAIPAWRAARVVPVTALRGE
ncbi:MAG: ABC transporter permease [Thermoanaerobaculia bacterium]|nr:ABC transporter permease [Thermoanaerobaculia bacterium]